MITLALSKGRILEETLPLLEAAGVVPSEHPDESRKLIIPTSRPDVRLIIVRATDVPTYVQYGGADLGVTGVIEIPPAGTLTGLIKRTLPDVDGTGAGLSIVKRMVERIGGAVGFESEPGSGTRFHIELPG